MRTVLFVANGIGIGGVLSVIGPILDQLVTMDLQVDFLNIGTVPEEMRRRWPHRVTWIELAVPSKRERLSALLRGGALFEKILTMQNANRPTARLAQTIDQELCKKMSPWEKEYDVAFATSEFFPSYYVATKVNAKKKLAMLHPRWDLLHLNNGKEYPYLEKINTIITVSEDCQKVLKETYPSLADRIVRLEHMFDASRIQKMARETHPSSLWDEGCRLVSVCRLDNRSKRLDRMVAAAKLLKQEKFRFHWVVVGGGPDQMLFQTIINESNLQPYFTLAGSRQNPYPYIAAAQLFVLTSQYEGMPVVVYEAAILQKPMVLTKCVDWPQSIRERASIVSNDDQRVCSELAAAIQSQAARRWTPPPYICDNTVQQRMISGWFA